MRSQVQADIHSVATSTATGDSLSSRGGLPRDRSIALWLLSLWLFVLAMVVVGGVTRLTGSGLSMVEWRPLMGALPPLSAAEWQDVFQRYQESPQYRLVNHWMGLSDFKRIFLWEYVHRLLGRLIGVVFLVPFLYFLTRRRLNGAATLRVGLAFLLGGAQGLLGWYMVKSGLVDRPEVSHFRLAAHLGLAFTVGMYLLWLALQAWPGLSPSREEPHWGARLRWLSRALWLLLGLQIVYGAFMAGLRAGVLFPTFPDMNGTFWPAPFFRYPSLLANLLGNPLAIHWLHRALGWVVLLTVAAFTVTVVRRTKAGPVYRAANAMAVLTVIQISTGAFTVIYGVPIGLAVAHQAFAYLLLSAAVWLNHGMVQRDRLGTAA